MADFKLLARKYKQCFGRPCGKDSRMQSKYQSLCEKFGESLVLAAFDQYLIANGWKKEKPPSLHFFFEECEQWVDDVREAIKEVEAEKNDADKYERAMIADRVVARNRVELELKEMKSKKESIKDIPLDAF